SSTPTSPRALRRLVHSSAIHGFFKNTHRARTSRHAMSRLSGGCFMSTPFKGVIKLDVRDSKPDWTPSTLKRAREGALNVLIVLYDDTGLAAWSPFGGRINMPTLQK